MTAMKKKQTSNLLLLGGVAAAAYFFFRPKDASAAGTVPVGPTPDNKPPEEDKQPAGTPPRDAPSLSGTVASNTTALTNAALAQVDQVNAVVLAEMNLGDDWTGPPPIADREEVMTARNLFNIPSGRSVASWITDSVYFASFGQGARVPAAGDQGSGWQPYIQIWTNVWNNVKDELLRGVNEVTG